MRVSSSEIMARAERLREILENCELCPRKCGVNRLAGEKGFCGLADAAHCFREVMHYGEEDELCPSHQVYFAGCNLRCEWCSVADWNVSPTESPELDIPAMRECIARRRAEGGRTLNLLGGEPAVSLYGILRLLAELPEDTRVVWNSNMYFSSVAAELLDGIADIYLADFKCGNVECSEKMLGVADYVEVVKDRIQFVRHSGELIVRYMVLSGHEACCMKPIFEWLAETLPDAKLSIRTDYLPPPEAVSAPANPATDVEVARAEAFAAELGISVIH